MLTHLFCGVSANGNHNAKKFSAYCPFKLNEEAQVELHETRPLYKGRATETGFPVIR